MTWQRDNQSDLFKPFPLFNLPRVVQWNILRKYVPVVTKIDTLGQLPEFSELLDCRSSWMNVSEEFVQLIPILRSLREDLYIPSEPIIPDHAYYVQRETCGNKITFYLCSISIRVIVRPPFKIRQFNVSTPVTNINDFLNYFLMHYCPVKQKPILAYEFERCFNILINPYENAAMWNELIYPIKNKTCMIKKDKNVSKFHSFINFTLDESDNMLLNFFENEYLLKPKSLESYLLNDDYFIHDYESVCDNWKEGPLPIIRQAGKFDIVLGGKEKISADVSTPTGFMCWRCNNECLFNKLSKTIGEKLFEWRNQPVFYEN